MAICIPVCAPLVLWISECPRRLQHHENEQVYKYSNKIIMDHFQQEEGMDADENLEPALVSGAAAAGAPCGGPAPAAPAHYAFGAAATFDFSGSFAFSS